MTADAPAAIVTGASRGIGAATARWLAAGGARVTLVARNEDGLRATAAAIAAAGGEAQVQPADLTDAAAAGAVVAAAFGRWGRLDAVVNNAAQIEPIARIATVELAAWTQTITVDLLAPLALTQAAIAHLRASRGRVLNLVSTAAHLPLAGLSAYCCGKAALHMLTRVLAAEEPDITALSVQPGPVDTDMHVALRAETDALDPERLAYYRSLPQQNQLRSADVPGRSLAWLALAAPAAWSGREIDHDDPEVTDAATAFFDRQETT